MAVADALVSKVIDQLVSLTEQEVRLVVSVRKEVENLTSHLRAIQAVLDDAEDQHYTEAAVKDSFVKLKDVSYDMDDVLDEWNTAILKSKIENEEETAGSLKKVCSFISSPCFSFCQIGLHRDIAVKIKDQKDALVLILYEIKNYKCNATMSIERPKRRETTPFIDLLDVLVRVDQVGTLKSKLLSESSQEKSCLHMISIVGMGGMGKTTLAQRVYNADDVKSHFEIRIWVCVSNLFDETKIAKTILERLTKLSPSDSLALGDLLQRIEECITGKKFLLVLDDVWENDDTKWNQLKLPFQSGSSGSRILVTTQKVISASLMRSTDTIELRELSLEDSRLLFSEIAFYKSSDEEIKELEQLGLKIVDKCKGLPLALKTLGSHLRFNRSREQWQNILNRYSDEVKDGIFAPLLFSFYDLAPTLKRCLIYCAIYPKGEKIDVDKLIKLWMAQGYLNSNESEDIEMIGQEYFGKLKMRCFFQNFEKDNYGRIINCRMHDMVHEFVQSLTDRNCIEMKVDENNCKELGKNSCCKARHLTITSSTKQMKVHSFVYRAKNLRALELLANTGHKFKTLGSNLFRHLTTLRTLDLSDQSITEVPEDVGRLIHLRYLDLSKNLHLKELPETMCNLCNLQILDLNGCSLIKLPQGMGKLINLRHLTVDQVRHSIKSFPKGFGRLSSLRKLNLFVVGDDNDSQGCKLGELKNLNHLQGSLEINGLGNLIEGCEAKNVELKDKIYLRDLHLIFKGVGEKNRRMENDNELLNALEPHPDLEFLKISEYHGTTMFRNWLMSIKLKNIELYNLDELERLPPLGRLPDLKLLKLTLLESVKKVGDEFLGKEINDNNLSSSSLDFFPTLENLEFEALKEWEEWDSSGGMSGFTIMQNLNSLCIRSCPKLNALPHFLQKIKLQNLEINGCPILRRRCKEGTGEDWPKISHIPNIKIDGLDVQGYDR